MACISKYLEESLTSGRQKCEQMGENRVKNVEE
jgi:hypothetical protein